MDHQTGPKIGRKKFLFGLIAAGVGLLSGGMLNKPAMAKTPGGVSVEDFPRLTGETDDTGRIRRAIEYARNMKVGSNSVGKSLYYESKTTVFFKSAFYRTSSPIPLYKGIVLEGEGRALLIASNPNKSYKCFTAAGEAGQFEARNLTFVGYSTALELSTGDIDVSMIVLENLDFHSCRTGVDTVSFDASRSTVLSVNNCKGWRTDVFLRNFCDMATLENCWITHSGWNGAAIYNEGHLNIKGGVFVPLAPQAGADPRWIDNYEKTVGQHGLFIDGARFGGEGGGGYPIVFNYAGADLELARNEGNLIVIQNSLVASAGTARDSNIVLFDLPNRISIRNCFGFKDLVNGIVSCDRSFNPGSIPYTPYISIDFDDSVIHNPAYDRIDPRLDRFYDTGDRRFRRTFGFSGRPLQPEAAGTGKAKVTVDIQQLTGQNEQEHRQLGFAMWVITSAPGSEPSTGFKCLSMALVTCVGGNAGSGVVKRLGFSVKDSFGGGHDFRDNCNVTSVHWGTGLTGSSDQPQSYTNTKVTIVFNCPRADVESASVTITPVHGMGL
ncbi:hypothetical protein GE107_20110 [Cohnella sp. CFH 77786]|uniref:glycoside hydrolase family 55 protein n=1 Tax=Cohnella sp. CFH 77786 TaxID=2662265 RepID=UPI001C610AC0|nr:glycoside hydrolase family 55 protein [Cohnella sp. CFH 77786]MBW5448351.1 hypothetical protein [Cohnella sp. CFH 77786]